MVVKKRAKERKRARSYSDHVQIAAAGEAGGQAGAFDLFSGISVNSYRACRIDIRSCSRSGFGSFLWRVTVSYGVAM